MSYSGLAAIAALLWSTQAVAQHAGHDMSGMDHGEEAPASEAASEPSEETGPAGDASVIDHSGHDMPSDDAAVQEVGNAPPPPPPTDHAADAFFDPAEMARARAALRKESGGMIHSKLMADQLEWRPGKGADGYSWDLEAWIGGDIDRAAFRSDGEGAFGEGLEKFEVQASWLHALDPWFNLRAGARRDFERGAKRTHGVVAIEGIAPYWFEVEGAIFLSTKGEVTARFEAEYDQRITQKLVLQPAIEVNASAQKVRALGLGAGVTSVELGARLRYEIERNFAPYVGINWERKLGRTARFARDEGEDVGGARMVIGTRFWF